MVVAPLSRAALIPARSQSRSMSERMVVGLTLRTATFDFAMGGKASNRPRPEQAARPKFHELSTNPACRSKGGVSREKTASAAARVEALPRYRNAQSDVA